MESRQMNPELTKDAPQQLIDDTPKKDDKKDESAKADYTAIAKKYGVPAAAGVAGWFVGGMIAAKVGKAQLWIKLGSAVVAAYKFNPVK